MEPSRSPESPLPESSSSALIDTSLESGDQHQAITQESLSKPGNRLNITPTEDYINALDYSAEFGYQFTKVLEKHETKLAPESSDIDPQNLINSFNNSRLIHSQEESEGNNREYSQITPGITTLERASGFINTAKESVTKVSTRETICRKDIASVLFKHYIYLLAQSSPTVLSNPNSLSLVQARASLDADEIIQAYSKDLSPTEIKEIITRKINYSYSDPDSKLDIHFNLEGDSAEKAISRITKALDRMFPKDPIPPYIRDLIESIATESNLDLRMIWNDGELETTEHSLQRLNNLSYWANHLARTFFPDRELHHHVANTFDFTYLNQVLTGKNLPVTANAFSKLISANFKVHAGHVALSLLQSHSLQISKEATQRLANRIYHHSVQLPDGRWVFNPSENLKSDPSSFDPAMVTKGSKQILFHRIAVANPKSFESSALKLMLSPTELTKESKIQDKVRMEMMLTAEASQDPEDYIMKTLAILLEMFGDDINLDRLRWTVNGGKTKGISTGGNRRFAVTGYYKYIDENKVEKRIPFEVQIRLYVPEDEDKADHDNFDDNKKTKLRKNYGIDVNFQQFTRDLIDIASNQSALRSIVTHYKNSRPISDRLITTLFQILNHPENRGLVEELVANEETAEKITEAIRNAWNSVDQTPKRSPYLEKLTSQTEDLINSIQNSTSALGPESL